MYKNALQSFCRFYKGEAECPFKDGYKQMFWLCEKWWTEQTIPATDAGTEQTIPATDAGCELITPILKEYTDAGLSSFELYDGVPITLKAVLFNRYCKYAERVDIEGFRKLYRTTYTKG